jgi:hypothetical protein
MKKRLGYLGVLLMMISCSPIQNICKGYQKVNGEVMYAVPDSGCRRNVSLLTPNGLIRIYGVPIEQPLKDIPVCKHKGRYYWVMP